MGHDHPVRRGTGKNKEEAWGNVADAYRAEYGWSHSIREVERETFIEKVPPKKWIETTYSGRSALSGRPWTETVHECREDPTAPPEEWLELWEFEFDVHV